MNPLILPLIELILTKGPDLAIKLIKTINSDKPTPEEIQELLDIKDPEEYFKWKHYY